MITLSAYPQKLEKEPWRHCYLELLQSQFNLSIFLLFVVFPHLIRKPLELPSQFQLPNFQSPQLLLPQPPMVSKRTTISYHYFFPGYLLNIIKFWVLFGFQCTVEEGIRKQREGSALITPLAM